MANAAENASKLGKKLCKYSCIALEPQAKKKNILNFLLATTNFPIQRKPKQQKKLSKRGAFKSITWVFFTRQLKPKPWGMIPGPSNSGIFFQVYWVFHWQLVGGGDTLPPTQTYQFLESSKPSRTPPLQPPSLQPWTSITVEDSPSAKHNGWVGGLRSPDRDFRVLWSTKSCRDNFCDRSELSTLDFLPQKSGGKLGEIFTKSCQL